MKQLLLCNIFALIFTNMAHAQEPDYSQEHMQSKQKLFASLDYCSSIAGQELFNLGAIDLKTLNEDLSITKANFDTFKKEKENCFDNAKVIINDIITDNMVYMQENVSDVLFEMQHNIDTDLAESIQLRKNINTALLDSIIKDAEDSITKFKTKLSSSFIHESKLTKKLISQELHVIYKSMQEQLDFDQAKLDTEDDLSFNKIVNISVRSAYLNLSKASLLFENIQQKPYAYNLAKISSFVDTSYNKLLEMKAFSKNLEDLDSKKDINDILNKLSILKVDLEVAVKDLSDDNFDENYLDWVGQIYQQTSTILTKLQSVLDTIYLIDITKEKAYLKPYNKPTENEEILEDVLALKTPIAIK